MIQRALVILFVLTSVFLMLTFLGVDENPRANLVECDLTQERMRVEFSGHILDVPSSYVEDCYPGGIPDSLGDIPPYINLKIPMKDFLPMLAHVGADQAVPDIRINLNGTLHPGSLENKAISQPLRFTGYELKIDREVYKKDKTRIKTMQKVYKKEKRLKEGLVYYTKTEIGVPIDANEVYVAEDKSGNELFLLRCGHMHSRCDCKSNSRKFAENLSYSYCYDEPHLGRAREIDSQVIPFLEQIISNDNSVDKK